MATHGTLRLFNVGELHKAIWLHAYSSGHTDEAYNLLTALPAVFVSRAVLSLRLSDQSIGKGWFLEQWSDEHWRRCLSACVSADASFIAGLVVASVFCRWLPCNPTDLPWQKNPAKPVADFDVICYPSDGRYKIHSRAETGFRNLEVDFLDDVYVGLKTAAAERQGSDDATSS